MFEQWVPGVDDRIEATTTIEGEEGDGIYTLYARRGDRGVITETIDAERLLVWFEKSGETTMCYRSEIRVVSDLRSGSEIGLN